MPSQRLLNKNDAYLHVGLCMCVGGRGCVCVSVCGCKFVYVCNMMESHLLLFSWCTWLLYLVEDFQKYNSTDRCPIQEHTCIFCNRFTIFIHFKNQGWSQWFQFFKKGDNIYFSEIQNYNALNKSVRISIWIARQSYLYKRYS